MLEPILGCNQTPDKQTPNKSSFTASSVDLDAVCFHPSRYLWHVYLMLYAAVFVSASLALIPFAFVNYYWVFVWIIFSGFLFFAIFKANFEKNKPPVLLEIKKNHWNILQAEENIAVQIKGDIVLWEWLIVLPLQEISTGKVRYIIALPDSLDKEEWRRLCVWLRTCLR